MKKYPKKRVPLFVFDEHNEAFHFWHRARHDGFINEPLDLFHIDAHHDMVRPDVFKKSLYFPHLSSQGNWVNYYEDFAKNELTINNFILPSVLNGLIKNVYFIYPKWRNFRPRRKKMNVCSAFGEGKILKYDLLIDQKPDGRVLKAFPDIRYFNYSMQEIDRVPQNRDVLLDIDLDYFACVDSISNHMSYELEITKEQFIKKDIFLHEKTLPFSKLDFNFVERDGKYYVIVSHKKIKEMSYLPTKEEIESDIETLVITLQTKNTQPWVITISKSCLSGYCPENYSEFIETRLKRRLSIFLNS